MRKLLLIPVAVGLFVLSIFTPNSALGMSLSAILWVSSLALVIVLFFDGMRYLERAMARPVRRNLCAYCGYDIRASKERCPECGNTISHAGSVSGPMGDSDFV